MKRQKGKRPWFIWLSVFLIVWIDYKAKPKRLPKTDEEFDRWMGYCGRFLGLTFGIIIIPGILMSYMMDMMPEPYAAIWNYLILIYVYFAGVFVADKLYQYWKNKY